MAIKLRASQRDASRHHSGHTDVIRQSGETRLTSIESLRALAALAVLAMHVFAFDYHWQGVFTGHVHQAIVSGGAGGVDVFFVLTGYLLFWPFARRDYGGGPAIRLSRYAINRALRILPLYYAAIGLLLATGLWMGSRHDAWRFLLFLENYSHRTFQTGDGPLWSLVVEVQFYVLLPLIVLVVARIARGSLRRAAVCICLLGCLSFALRVLIQTSVADHALWDASLPTTIYLFTLGMLLALLRLHWERRPPQRIPDALLRSDTWIVAAVLFWMAYIIKDTAPAFQIPIAAASFCLVGSAALPLRRGRSSRVLEWRPLAMLGIASYSLYVLHVPIVNKLAGTSLASFGAAGLLRFALVAVPLCCAVALISYAIIERPFLRLRRRWVGPAPVSPEPVIATPPSPASPAIQAQATP